MDREARRFSVYEAREAAVSYVQEIFQKLKDYEYNESLMQLHFMGGGARIVETVGEYNRERTHFNHDICATAKGYEYYCYMILRHNKKCSWKEGVGMAGNIHNGEMQALYSSNGILQNGGETEAEEPEENMILKM